MAAVTLDDGPSATTPRLLDALDEAGIPATFFVSGRAALEHARELCMIRDRGHAIASHGFAHEELTWKSRQAVEDDLLRSLDAISMVSGLRPALYRPPFGRLHPKHRDIPSHLGCALVLWSVLPEDYDRSLPMDTLLRRMADVGRRDILVLHDKPGCVDRTIRCLRQLAEARATSNLQYRTIT